MRVREPVGALAQSWPHAVDGAPLSAVITPSATVTLEAGRIGALCFSADGRHLLLGCADALVREWSLKTQVPVRIFEGHKGAIAGLDMMADGSRLLTASADKTAIVWDMASAAPTATIVGHAKPIPCAAFSPAGPMVLTASLDGTLRLWDEETGAAIHTTKLPAAQTAFAAMDDGTVFVQSEHDQMARLDPETGETVATILGPRAPVVGLCKSPSHHAIAILTAEGGLSVADAESGACYESWTLDDAGAGAVLFTPDGATLIAATAKRLGVFDMRSGRTIGTFAHAGGGGAPSLAVSPDAVRLAWCGGGRAAYVFDLSRLGGSG